VPQPGGLRFTRLGRQDSEIPRSLMERSGNPASGATGIGILAFHLLDPASVLAGVS